MSRNLASRIAVASVAIPAILWISFQGGWWLVGMISVLALTAAVEFLTAEGYRPKDLLFWPILIAVAVNILQVELRGSEVMALATMLMVLVFMFLAVGCGLALSRQEASALFTRYTRLFWGACYLALMYPFVVLVGRGTDSLAGGYWLLFLFAILWVGDTAAMAGGKMFGRHKLAPKISPNKTVEGFFSGLVGAAIVGVAALFWKFSSIDTAHIFALALGCSVVGQMGDLVESMWKRSLNLKDSSAIIPGHGGMLDRFDSLLFAAPFMYMYIRLWQL